MFFFQNVIDERLQYKNLPKIDVFKNVVGHQLMHA